MEFEKLKLWLWRAVGAGDIISYYRDKVIQCQQDINELRKKVQALTAENRQLNEGAAAAKLRYDERISQYRAVLARKEEDLRNTHRKCDEKIIDISHEAADMRHKIAEIKKKNRHLHALLANKRIRLNRKD